MADLRPPVVKWTYGSENISHIVIEPPKDELTPAKDIITGESLYYSNPKSLVLGYYCAHSLDLSVMDKNGHLVPPERPRPGFFNLYEHPYTLTTGQSDKFRVVGEFNHYFEVRRHEMEPRTLIRYHGGIYIFLGYFGDPKIDEFGVALHGIDVSSRWVIGEASYRDAGYSWLWGPINDPQQAPEVRLAYIGFTTLVARGIDALELEEVK